MNVIITTRNPMMLNQFAFLPFHPLTYLRCRYMAYTRSVINDHVSLGSHPQYLPQALFAHTAPAIIPKARNGKPKATDLYTALSNRPSSGIWSSIFRNLIIK